MSKTSDNCQYGGVPEVNYGYGQCFNKLECSDTDHGKSHVCDHDRNCHFACSKYHVEPVPYIGKKRRR